MSAVSLGTQAQILDTLTRYMLDVPLREYFQPLPYLIDFIEHFSVFKSIMSLLTVEKGETGMTFMEASGIVLMVGTTFVQSAVLLESSLGLSVLCEYDRK